MLGHFSFSLLKTLSLFIHNIVERVKFDLTNTLKSRINDFNELANFQKKFIATDIDNNLYYNGDQQAIIQLMDILLENAIKYAPQNSDINISL